MQVVRRIQFALVAACFPFAAHATAFKCTLPGGGTTYQDTPCQGGAAQQSVSLTNSSSALVTLMADASMIVLHTVARRDQKMGRLPDAVAGCLASLKGTQFDDAAQRALTSAMSSGDLQMANTYLAGASGRKFSKMVLFQIYTALGEPSPDPAPVMNSAEERDFQRFAMTSAGQLLINQHFLANSELAPAISARTEELKKSCGAHR
jgi:hypothetical protein